MDQHSGRPHPRLRLQTAVLAGGVILLSLIASLFVIMVFEQRQTERIAAYSREQIVPSILERQRAVINIERLRQYAMVMTVTDDPLRRREALFAAQALAFHPSFQFDQTLSRQVVAAFGVMRRAADMKEAAIAKQREADTEAGTPAGDAARAASEALEKQLSDLLQTTLGDLDTLGDHLAVDATELTAGQFALIQDNTRLVSIIISIAFLLVLATEGSAIWLIRRHIIRPLIQMADALRRIGSDTVAEALPAGTTQEIDRIVHAVVRLDRQTEELRLARDQAEDATRAKSSFLAVMSHEIRTPMNGVTAMAEMLESTALSNDQRGMVEMIRASGDALLAIINDILDFSKIEAGHMEIEAIEFSIADLVEDAVDVVAARADEKSLQLAVDLGADLPSRLVGDPNRLRQVLINLVGNAIKFNENGGVTIQVRRQPAQTMGRAVLLLEVIDSGIGLTPEQQTRLFQAFQQADNSTSRRYGGTGLGLTICHKLCVLMGGEIGVRSAVGRGSTFWCRVPFGVVEPAPERPEVQIDDARVAAIGFGDMGWQALNGILQLAGIEDIVGINLENALPARVVALATRGTIVLVHGADARGQGMELVRGVLRIDPALASRIIVARPRAMTSVPSETEIAGLHSVPLPLGRRRLWQALAAALGRAVKEPARTAPPDATNWMPPPIEEAIAAGALVLVAEDNPVNQAVIRLMLEQRGYAVEIVDNGLEALARYRPRRYGLLLTDFHMPEMDGFTLARAIREREQANGDHLPIVALTADVLPDTERTCIVAGMDGFLAKPIDSRLLVEALDRYLPQGRELRRERPRVPAISVSVSVSRPASMREAWGGIAIDARLFDPARLAESFGANRTAGLAFFNLFLTKVPAMITAIDVALIGADPSAGVEAAHALMGAARSIGAVRLGQIATDVQAAFAAGDIGTARLMTGLLAPTLKELIEATEPLRASAFGP
jgi:two-component system, sensor histidine kinase and response regulator